jgi:hypothetical protein
VLGAFGRKLLRRPTFLAPADLLRGFIAPPAASEGKYYSRSNRRATTAVSPRKAQLLARNRRAQALFTSRYRADLTTDVCPVCTENLNPHIMMMKSAKDRV